MTELVIERTLGYSLTKVSPRLWRLLFYFPAPVNCWFWQENDGLTLIDAAQPWNAKEILKAVGLIGVPLKRLLITHAHPDHAGAAAQVSTVSGATVYAHEKDICYLQGRASMADTDGRVPSRLLLRTARAVSMLDNPPVESVTPISDGQKCGSLVCIFTPGHTPGSVSFWCNEDGSLFCGDNMNTMNNRLNANFTWFTLDYDTLKNSLQRYRALAVSAVFPGHGPALIGEKCRSQMALL